MWNQIRAEAAYLYDAVHLYTRALIRVIESDENPRNGTAIINSLKGSSYLSAMGYVTSCDVKKGKSLFFFIFHLKM